MRKIKDVVVDRSAYPDDPPAMSGIQVVQPQLKTKPETTHRKPEIP